MSDSGFDLGLDDPRSAGVYAIGTQDIDVLAAAARDAGLRACRIDLHDCRDKATLLTRIAAQLDFPHGSGRNWDALADRLGDLSWLPGPGYALLFEGAELLRHEAGKDFDTLLDVLDEVSTSWAEHGVPFWVFLELPADMMEP